MCRTRVYYVILAYALSFHSIIPWICIRKFSLALSFLFTVVRHNERIMFHCYFFYYLYLFRCVYNSSSTNNWWNVFIFFIAFSWTQICNWPFPKTLHILVWRAKRTFYVNALHFGEFRNIFAHILFDSPLANFLFGGMQMCLSELILLFSYRKTGIPFICRCFGFVCNYNLTSATLLTSISMEYIVSMCYQFCISHIQKSKNGIKQAFIYISSAYLRS